MTRNFILLFLVVLSFVSLVHADVGPSPDPPVVTVYLVNNGAPDTSISEVTYHCRGTESNSTSSMDPGIRVFPCTSGTCKNTGNWFYNFNPCFNFPEGYFSYEVNGGRKKTNTFTPTGGQAQYSFTIDTGKGEIVGQTSTSGICAGAFVLATLFLGMVGKWR